MRQQPWNQPRDTKEPEAGRASTAAIADVARILRRRRKLKQQKAASTRQPPEPNRLAPGH